MDNFSNETAFSCNFFCLFSFYFLFVSTFWNGSGRDLRNNISMKSGLYAYNMNHHIHTVLIVKLPIALRTFLMSIDVECHVIFQGQFAFECFVTHATLEESSGDIAVSTLYMLAKVGRLLEGHAALRTLKQNIIPYIWLDRNKGPTTVCKPAKGAVNNYWLGGGGLK